MRASCSAMRAFTLRSREMPAGVRYNSWRRRSTLERLRITRPRSSSRSVIDIMVARSMSRAAATDTWDTPGLALISHNVAACFCVSSSSATTAMKSRCIAPLRTPQPVAQQAVELFEHEFRCGEGFRRFGRPEIGLAWHQIGLLDGVREIYPLAKLRATLIVCSTYKHS
jgi:hypothetical protein